MPLFACRNCCCIENTATSNNWYQDEEPVLCTECDPDVAQWHGLFEKRSAAGMLVDDAGLLWSKEAFDAGRIPIGFNVLGVVLEPRN